MNSKASTFMACGITTIVATIAQFNGHVEPLAFYQIIGSIVCIAILTPILAGFK